MTRSVSRFHFGHEYDDFLLASIGEEKNGMVLSVLSTLARQDIDPWQEAARLARLPRDVATGQLSALIAALPANESHRATARAVAERLITPLFSKAAPNPLWTETIFVRAKSTSGDMAKFAIAAFLIVLVLSLFLARQAPTGDAPTSVPPANPVGTETSAPVARNP